MLLCYTRCVMNGPNILATCSCGQQDWMLAAAIAAASMTAAHMLQGHACSQPARAVSRIGCSAVAAASMTLLTCCKGMLGRVLKHQHHKVQVPHTLAGED